jgi:Zn-finger nucleic acid-binding protein
MTKRQGVEIDYFPQCRGVRLDRGELDKLIERSMGLEMLGSEPRQPSYSHEDDEHAPRHSSYVQDHRRKKSWISEIFD